MTAAPLPRKTQGYWLWRLQTAGKVVFVTGAAHTAGFVPPFSCIACPHTRTFAESGVVGYSRYLICSFTVWEAPPSNGGAACASKV